MKVKIAENIRNFRKEHSLTQEQLAEAMGVTVGAVYKWEAGLSTPEIKLNSKFISCLKAVDDNLAFAQGFGRNARLAVTLREDKDGFYLTYSGMVFKKARD